MIKVYHGSTEVVEHPEIRKPNRTLDYGFGFYVTTSYEQALQWVERRLKEKHVSRGYVNVYDYNESVLKSELRVLSFGEPTEEWVDFVMQNRTQKDFDHDYDVVYGPVANDRVYTQFALYEGGIIGKSTLISELKTYKLVDQFLFHTERALNALTFKEAKEVEL